MTCFKVAEQTSNYDFSDRWQHQIRGGAIALPSCCLQSDWIDYLSDPQVFKKEPERETISQEQDAGGRL